MSKIDEKFIVSLKGKTFITYEGLLDLAHKEGLQSIETNLIQIPTKDNDYLAIVQATAYAKDKKFMGIGDCDNKSANSMIAPHKIRMAETRAKARALRDFTNIGMTAFEELGNDEEEQNKVDENKKALADNSYATDSQVNLISKLIKDKKKDVNAIKGWMKDNYKKDDFKALTQVEASTIIEILNKG